MSINALKRTNGSAEPSTELPTVQTADDLNGVLIATLMEHRAGKISGDAAKATAMVAGKIIRNTELAFRYGTQDGKLSTIKLRS